MLKALLTSVGLGRQDVKTAYSPPCTVPTRRFRWLIWAISAEGERYGDVHYGGADFCRQQMSWLHPTVLHGNTDTATLAVLLVYLGLLKTWRCIQSRLIKADEQRC